LLPRFGNEQLRLLGDAAVIGDERSTARLSTDGYTVTPLFFPVATSAAWQCLVP